MCAYPVPMAPPHGASMVGDHLHSGPAGSPATSAALTSTRLCSDCGAVLCTCTLNVTAPGALTSVSEADTVSLTGRWRSPVVAFTVGDGDCLPLPAALQAVSIARPAITQTRLIKGRFTGAR